MSDYYAQLDAAKAYGLEYANNGIAAGERLPEDSPLSGEWAGAITWQDIARHVAPDVDLDKVEDFEITDLCDHWESGYLSANWPGYCKLGDSSLGSQVVCVKCGDECACYVCVEGA